MYTNVRPVDEKVVYVVEGFIKMSIQPNIDTYRAKTLCAIKNENITKLSFDYPGQDKFTLQNQNGKWYLDGVETDSTNTARYLLKFGRLTSNNFVDDFQPSGTPTHMLTIEGNNTMPFGSVLPFTSLVGPAFTGCKTEACYRSLSSRVTSIRVSTQISHQHHLV